MAISIIFIDNDGKVNELQFSAVSQELIEVNLYRNVGEYENIVSVVSTSSYGGNSAILIDKDGNEYEYAGAMYK